MKRKELILLENRLRKLLKEDTIKDPIDNVEVEVAPGVKLPPIGPSGKNFDFIWDTGDGSSVSFNQKIRPSTQTKENDWKKFPTNPYDKGVVRYKNTNDVVMYFYAKQNPYYPQIPDIEGFMGNTSDVTLDDNFKKQEEWNNFVKRINSKKAKTSSVGVTGVDKNKTTQIQQFISDNFKDYVTYLGTKPVDGYWGVKTDEAILRIIHDIEQKTKT